MTALSILGGASGDSARQMKAYETRKESVDTRNHSHTKPLTHEEVARPRPLLSGPGQWHVSFRSLSAMPRQLSQTSACISHYSHAALQTMSGHCMGCTCLLCPTTMSSSVFCLCSPLVKICYRVAKRAPKVCHSRPYYLLVHASSTRSMQPVSGYVPWPARLASRSVRLSGYDYTRTMYTFLCELIQT